jgi:hypothetical protein
MRPAEPSPERVAARGPDLAANSLLHGAEDLPQHLRPLRAGPLSAVLDGVDLRYVRVGTVEVARRIYAAVRDRNWNTIVGVPSEIEVDDRGDSFGVRFSVRHVSHDIDFVWEGAITGGADGRITFSFDGVAHCDLLYDRIGFCVLHPSRETIGQPYRARTPDGEVAGTFPIPVAPQRFEDGVYVPLFASFDQLEIDLADGGAVRFDFEGDLWETEDQRNWTDASFKSYCTPLKLGFPHELQEGEPIRQRVTVSVESVPATVADRPTGTETCLKVAGPAAETLPRLGLAAPSDAVAPTARELELLRALDLDHLRAEARLGTPGWEGPLDVALELRRQLGWQLELAVFLRSEHELELARLAARVADVPLARVLVVCGGGQSATPLETTPVDLVELVRRHIGHVPVAGGTDLNFCELNRTRPAADAMEGIFYPITPQVHAFDDISIIETLEAQSDTVKTALTFAREKPVIVSPVTLRRRFNTVAVTGEAGPAEGELPDPVDPRQLSLLGAGWTTGSVKFLAEGGATSLTYFETTGWRGVLERETGSPLPERFPSHAGEPFPLYHVFRDLGELKGGTLLTCASTDALSAVGLAIRRGSATTTLVANLTATPRTVRLEGLHGPARVRRLNSETAALAGSRPSEFRRAWEAIGEPLVLELLPFETARIDASGEGAR